MALTFSEAKERLKFKFPKANISLKIFRGTDELYDIYCAIHGDQTISRFSNLMTSKFGCAECAAESRKDQLAPSRTKSVLKYQELVAQVRLIPITLTDVEYRAEVLRLTSTERG